VLLYVFAVVSAFTPAEFESSGVSPLTIIFEDGWQFVSILPSQRMLVRK